MNPSNSSEKSSMSRNKPTKARSALCRSWAVSKIFWKRNRSSYSARSRGSFPNSARSFCLSGPDNSQGLRRNSHISERNSFRWTFDSLALYARVIFFPLLVDRLVEQLGDVKAIDHRLGLGQQRPAGVVERLGHIGPVGLHLLPLLKGQLFQAFAGRCLVPPVGHRQHLGLFGV